MIAVVRLIALWSINMYDSHYDDTSFDTNHVVVYLNIFLLSCDIMLVEDTKEVTKYFIFNCFSLYTFSSGLLDTKLFKYPDLRRVNRDKL